MHRGDANLSYCLLCWQENAALKQELKSALSMLAVYETGAGVADIYVSNSIASLTVNHTFS